LSRKCALAFVMCVEKARAIYANGAVSSGIDKIRSVQTIDAVSIISILEEGMLMFDNFFRYEAQGAISSINVVGKVVEDVMGFTRYSKFNTSSALWTLFSGPNRP